MKPLSILFSLLGVLSTTPCLGQSSDKTDQKDLSNMGLEDLMKLEVTTASKKAQSIHDVAASVTIITQDDILKSGATNLPDLLRKVPGVNVARVSSSSWAVSIRGFNDRWSNKLMVLVDGRSVYNPLFSGVVWNLQRFVMEDIERIEIMRGPAGALWGADSVNGVINIITKAAKDTQGVLVSQTAGDHDRSLTSLRYGESLGDKSAFRVFGQTDSIAGSLNGVGLQPKDDWTLAHGGFRFDTESKAGNFTFEGDAYYTRVGQTSIRPILAPPFFTLQDERSPGSDYSLLAKWSKTDSHAVETSFQAFVDRYHSDSSDVLVDISTLDLDFQQHRLLSPKNDLVWGLGYRINQDDTKGTAFVNLTPANQRIGIASMFGQLEHKLASNLKLTFGAKLEHNDLSGWDFLPDLRLLWNRSTDETLWASVSRGVKTPSPIDRGVAYNAFGGFDPQSGLPINVRVSGSPDFQTESAVTGQLGYRHFISDHLSVDATVFLSDYNSLSQTILGTPFVSPGPPPVLIVPSTLVNGLHGTTHGLELETKWSPGRDWDLGLTYSYLKSDLKGEDGSSADLHAPMHQATLSSTIGLFTNIKLATDLRYTDAVKSEDVSAHWGLDARLIWSLGKDRQLLIGATNLFSPRRYEAFENTSSQIGGLVGPSAFAQLVWKF